MNGQHLRSYSEEAMLSMIGGELQKKGLLKNPQSPFSKAFVAMASNSLELVTDAEQELASLLSFPLEETLADEKCKEIVEDGFKVVVDAILTKADSGELEAAAKEGTMKVLTSWACPRR